MNINFIILLNCICSIIGVTYPRIINFFLNSSLFNFMTVFFHNNLVHLFINMFLLNSTRKYESKAMQYITFYYIIICNYILPKITDSQIIPIGFSGITFGMHTVYALRNFYCNKFLVREELLYILLLSLIIPYLIPQTTLISHLVGIGLGFIYIKKN